MQILQPVEAVILASCIAALARRARLLSASGAWAAFAVGFLVFGLGGLAGAVPLLAFFVSSNLLGRWRRAQKERLGFEKGGERDWAQVLANSAVAVIVLSASTLFLRFHISDTSSRVLYVAFASAISAANADTWATELGAALPGRPRLITTMRLSDHGRSGAVSAFGSLGAALGAVAIAASAAPFVHSLRIEAVIALSGVVGAFADSLLGASAQALYRQPDGTVVERKTPGAVLIGGIGWVNNDVVNFSATVAAALLSIALTSNSAPH